MSKFVTRGRLAYVAFLLLFTLAVLEIGSRWYLANVLQKSSQRKFQFNAYRIYGHVPGFQESDENGPRLSINGQGFRRATDIISPKPAGTRRIFLMGGSAAHGISSAAPYPVAHVRDNETIDAHLEQLLQQRYPGRPIEVINAAVTGYQVFQHTAYIQSELLDLEPDLFIFFDGYNDHFKFAPEEDLYGDNIYQFWTGRLQQPSLGGLFDHVMLWASNFSGLARGYYAWKSNKDADEKSRLVNAHTNDWSNEQIRAGYLASRERGYLRAIGNNLALLEHHGIDAVVCMQPGVMFRDQQVMAPIERDQLFSHVPFRAVLMPLILDDMKNVTTTFDVPFIDLNPPFNDPRFAGEQLFLDYCHLTPLGGQRAAEILLPAVERAFDGRDEAMIRDLTLH